MSTDPIRVTFRQVGAYWIAYHGRQAIWEDVSRAALENKLREMGITDAEWAPLRIILIRG